MALMPLARLSSGDVIPLTTMTMDKDASAAVIVAISKAFENKAVKPAFHGVLAEDYFDKTDDCPVVRGLRFVEEKRLRTGIALGGKNGGPDMHGIPGIQGNRRVGRIPIFVEFIADAGF